MILIGLSGPAGSGKDTAADALVRHMGFEKLAFADTLKRGICEMFYLGHEIFDTREAKESKIPGMNHSPRDLAKIIGTDCVRAMIGENIWVHVMAKRYQDFCAAGFTRIVISDVRFDNEAEWIRRAGGTVVHIVRPSVSWEKTGHESERGIAVEPDDRRLHNQGSVGEFGRITLAMADEIIWLNSDDRTIADFEKFYESNGIPK